MCRCVSRRDLGNGFQRPLRPHLFARCARYINASRCSDAVAFNRRHHVGRVEQEIAGVRVGVGLRGVASDLRRRAAAPAVARVIRLCPPIDCSASSKLVAGIG